MALVNCPECGKEIFSEKTKYCPYCGKEIKRIESQTGTNNKIKCPGCCGTNINISVETVGSIDNSIKEVRNKSVVTRTANKAGRKGMMLMTGGLWGLTPKRSENKMITKGKTEYIMKKVAVCQDCGNAWYLP